MRFRTALTVGLLAPAAWGVIKAQKPFKEWPAIEYSNFALPTDSATPHEWTRARLRYPDITGYPDYTPDFAGYWTMDYPRSDRHLLQGVRRLTRIDARSVEQVVELDGTDEIYNWPTAYGVEVGHWALPQKRKLEVVDIRNDDPIFHSMYDLDDRVQIPGAQYLQTGRIYEKDESGRPEHWRAVYDDKGRIVVAICHNMDLGDAWEWSDDPRYPEKWAALAYRIAMNYFIYDLTH
jgi:hypothetical protein